MHLQGTGRSCPPRILWKETADGLLECMHSPSTSLHTDGPTALGNFPSQLHSHVIHVTPEPGELLTGEPRGQPGTVAAAASLGEAGSYQQTEQPRQ